MELPFLVEYLEIASQGLLELPLLVGLLAPLGFLGPQVEVSLGPQQLAFHVQSLPLGAASQHTAFPPQA